MFQGARLGNRWCFGEGDREVFLSVEGNLVLNNENAIRRAALAAGGIAQLPSCLVGVDHPRGTLVPLLRGYPRHRLGMRREHLRHEGERYQGWLRGDDGQPELGRELIAPRAIRAV
ncbi:MAG: hypothetical protein ABI920_04745 [Casimicrobiaceae bacterium]